MGTKNTSDALAEVNKKDNEPNWGHNPAAPLEPEKAGSGKGGNGSNGKNGSNGNNGSGNSSGNGSGNGSTGAEVDSNYKNTVKQAKKDIKENSDEANKKTLELADKKNVEYPEGKTADGYINMDSLNAGVDKRKRELEQAKLSNKTYQDYLKFQENLKERRGQLKSALKGVGKDTRTAQEIQAELDNVNKSIAENEATIKLFESGDPDETKWNDPAFSNKSMIKELSKQQSELAKQGTSLQKALDNRVELDKLTEDFKGFTGSVRENIGGQLELLKANYEKTHDPVLKSQIETAEGILSAVAKMWEDGVIDPEEVKVIGEIGSNIEKMAEMELLNDENFQSAEERLRSAKAKRSYYLFDQIKSWAAFIIGLSAGNTQMVYSALDNYNKKIADAENKFQTDELEAFSNNNVKEITSDSDASYTLAQLFPQIKNEELKRKFQRMDKAEAILQLREAYDTFTKEVGKPDSDGFRAWFTTQTANTNANSAMGILGELIKAGALNFDALKSAFGGSGSSDKPKGKDVSALPKGPGYGSKLFNGVNPYNNGKANELAKAVSDKTNVARDKQITEQNNLGARLAGGAPQMGTPGSGQNWGKSIG